MKTHGRGTPHAQWDHGPLLTGRATQAIDPHQASPPSCVQKANIPWALALRGGVMTSIVRFIKEAEVGSVFDDHATKAMGEAFEAACKDLDEAGQPSVVYEAVAKRIIEIAKSGERDPNQLRDRALTTFGHKRP